MENILWPINDSRGEDEITNFIAELTHSHRNISKNINRECFFFYFYIRYKYCLENTSHMNNCMNFSSMFDMVL